MFIYTSSAILIVPFVSVYTKGIHDANYINIMVGVLISLAYATYCLRIPYNTLIMSAGHFKETQNSALVEATVNIVISVLLVFKFGLVGVAMGTLCAMIYRLFSLSLYANKKILQKNNFYTIKLFIFDILYFVFCNIVFKKLSVTICNSYLDWLLLSLKTGVMTFAIMTILVSLFFRGEIKLLYNYKKGTL